MVRKVAFRRLSDEAPRVVSAKRMESILRHGVIAWTTQCLVPSKSLSNKPKYYHDDLQPILDRPKIVVGDIPPNGGFEPTIKLEKGHIRPSSRPLASFVVLVKNKD